jgi:ligand-binding SRPBCC domain-containing protein
MVHLEFTIPVNANLQTVWDYFSRFEIVPEWDPNTKVVRTLKKTPQ